MSKCINAEKLIAEIEGLIEKANIERQKSPRPQFTLSGKIDGLKQALNLVRSFQQEQPEVDEQEYGPYARQYPKSKVSQE